MWLRFLFVLALSTTVLSVDHDVFKYCNQSDFCGRLRDKQPYNFFSFDQLNIVETAYAVSFSFSNKYTNEDYVLNISAIKNEIFRLTAYEADNFRYRIPKVFEEEPELAPLDSTSGSDEDYTIVVGNSRAVVNYELFTISFYKNDVLEVIFNADPQFYIENDGVNESFTFSVYYPKALRAYGIPEHADRLALRETVDPEQLLEPYRLYNLDVAFYELDSPMALYGSVPILYGHSVNYTAAVYVHNAAEQWIDIQYSLADGVKAYFMVESGAIDIFILTGPTPQEVSTQFSFLVGVSPLPQLWALGYHTCRWNYLNQEDVKDVIANFDNYDFPIDVIWGDVDTQDYHRYFTWHPEDFSDPIEMLNNLSTTDRKFVTHVDPHYMVDPEYFVYSEALEHDYFVKDAEGNPFIGECWPGNSSYIDFLNPEAVDFYRGLFAYDRFNGSTPTLAGIWNDMNEPSVFNDSLEKTFPKYNQLYGGVIHRDVHNIYGFLQTIATYQGLLDRDNRTQRPFILSRSFFAGSQRYAAVWTGDNTADWPYLASTYPMCLSINLAGIPFCGADMGGFFYEPDTQLLTRWYQAGAWLPFFRAHASQGTARREPYLYEEDVQDRLRRAMRQRYAHLPYWYTLFFEHYYYGTPVIRPLFYEYPYDSEAVDIDKQLLVGSSIMPRLVDEPNATIVEVYLPGEYDLWFDIETPLVYNGDISTTVEVDLDSIPVFYKGGSVIPRKGTPRRNTKDMFNDTYTIYIFENLNGTAEGTLYTDDTESFDYIDYNAFSYVSLQYSDGQLDVNPIIPTEYDPNFVVDSYVIYRLPTGFSFNKNNQKEPLIPEKFVYKVGKDGQLFKDQKVNLKGAKLRIF